jgi:dihydrofolate reductase
MKKIILVVHTSLDGFVAGPNGELDLFEPGEENLQFVSKLTESADTAMFGRVSYELLDRHWPNVKDNPHASKGEVAYSRWYNGARKVVISRTMAKQNIANTTVISDNLAGEITKLRNQPGKDILIFGSPRASQELMRLGLIDSYWIFINPAIFGTGIPLFKPFKNRTKLKLITTTQFSNGELAIQYEVLKHQ